MVVTATGCQAKRPVATAFPNWAGGRDKRWGGGSVTWRGEATTGTLAPCHARDLSTGEDVVILACGLVHRASLRSWMSCALSAGDNEQYRSGDPIDLVDEPGDEAGVLHCGELKFELGKRHVEANET